MRMLWVLMVFCLMVISSCKYEEGPFISLRTVKQRLRGCYNLEYYRVNGADSAHVVYDFFKNPIYGFYFGEWEYASSQEKFGFGPMLEKNESCKNYIGWIAHEVVFNDNKTKIALGWLHPLDRYWEILKLTNKQLHLRKAEGGNVYELGFVSK